MLGSALKEEAFRLKLACKEFDRNLAFQETAETLSERIVGNNFFIHAAANTNVEECEVDPDRCYRDNFLLTELLAKACSLVDVPFLFISSTGVYGEGKKTAYKEYDTVNPTTHYHNSKFMAEQVTLNAHPKNIVIRTGWLFGGKVENPKNFVARRMDEAREAFHIGVDLQSNFEQKGIPCFNLDIAARILLIAEYGYSGIFNCVNCGFASRFEYVDAIIRLAKIDVRVRGSVSSKFNRKALVSNNEMAENWKMDNLKLPKMPLWEDSLKSYIDLIKNI